MRKTLLTIFIVIPGVAMLAQDIHFPPAIVAAGGSSGGDSHTSLRWRLAPVHLITIPDSKLVIQESDWDVSLYPNPVKDQLTLNFKLSDQRTFVLKLVDLNGRIIFQEDGKSYINGSIVNLDLSRFTSAIYILQIATPELMSQKSYRIEKL